MLKFLGTLLATSNSLNAHRGVNLSRRRGRQMSANSAWRIAETLELRTLLAAQAIMSDEPVKDVAAGQIVSIPVGYQTLNDAGVATALAADGISFNLHFDSSALTFVNVTNLFTEGIQTQPTSARLETDAAVKGMDSSPETDMVLLTSYLNASGWPATQQVNERVLYVANFRANAGFIGTTVDFSVNTSGNRIGQAGTFTFQAQPVTVQPLVGKTISIANAAPANEGSNAVFTVTLSEASTTPVTVKYSTFDENGPTGAIAGTDYVAQTNQTLTFSAGQTTQTIPIATLTDSEIDPDETFTVVLSNPTGASLGNDTAVGTIVDLGSALPGISIGSTVSVVEGGSAVFTVTLSKAATTAVTVGYATADGDGPTAATAGTDYTARTAQTLTFNAGETQKTITVATTNDTLAEASEEFFLNLTNPNGGVIQVAKSVATILDNDSGGGLPGDVDGNAQFNANDAFLIQLIRLSGTDAQINQSKGSSPLTAGDIRARVSLLDTTGGNVDGNTTFDANDSFLIQLIQLSGSDAQINQSKGSSTLTAAQIRTNTARLGTASSSLQVLNPVVAAPSPSVEDNSTDNQDSGFAELAGVNLFSSNSDAESVQKSVSSVWTKFREWIDSI